jgi:two-component system sensor histidine kinase BaeS
MLKTLRRRFILSHVLPLLIVMPLMGIALIYILETQVLLPDLTHDVMEDAGLTAEIAGNQIDIWRDHTQAQSFLDRYRSWVVEPMMLLDAGGYLLAASDPADAERLGQRLDFPGLTGTLAGEPNAVTYFSQHYQTNVIDASAPVVGLDKQVLGLVRVTFRLSSVYGQYLRQRYLIAQVLAMGLILGAVVGGVLALNLERPLRQLTMAVHRLAVGQQLTPLPEQGPEEIRLLLHAFNTLAQRLNELEQNRRQFLANLVHELGRPLGALHSAIEALLRGADQDTELRQEFLAGMDEEVGRMRRLLDDLARLHDQMLGPLELDRQAIALSDWLTRMMTLRSAAAQEKGLHWQVAIPAGLPTVSIDPDRLGQALGNLVHNAIKYTPANGTVSISAGVDNSQVWIRVSDTGPGIAPEEQAHIFTPSYRGRAARPFSQGMGLGLSIARDLIVAHGGRLELTSTPGQGSHFTLWLPLT